jgi:glycosyltransferase involved in cell wall biosynthesis
MEFPEVNFNWEFESRERLYTGILRKAVAVIADSEVGSVNLSRRYGIDRERIHHIPFYVSTGIQDFSEDDDILKKLFISPLKYIFYPAQFWPHKNHTYILNALRNLQLEGINISCVFTGSDKGNLKNVQAYAKQLNLSGSIKFPGYVSNEELNTLYKNALALVMPTYFGPTNIPPIEAIKIGIPVICSEIDGHKELLGNAALYCDLDDTKSLERNIKNLISNDEMRISLITNGHMKYQQLEQQRLSTLISKICDSYSSKSRNWIQII